MSKREFDIVVFGANGFTGAMCCDHIVEAANSTLKGLKIAIAGRNRAKVEETAKKTGLDTNRYPIIIADTSDSNSLDEMCKRTRILITTVGPYTLYGMPVVDACVRSGTHMLDITGEITYVARYTEKHHDEAIRKGIYLLSMTAFDSMPAELTNMYLHQYAAKRNLPAGSIDRVEGAWRFEGSELFSAFSGGTMYSTSLFIKTMKKRDLHPLSLLPSCVEGKEKAPPEFRDFVEPPNGFPMQVLVQPSNTSLFGKGWIAPFMLSGTNEKVVRKNNVIRGVKASYKEFLVDDSFKMAVLSLLFMFVYIPLVSIPYVGEILRRFTAYAPGEGPSKEISSKGKYHFTAIGYSKGVPTLRAKHFSPFEAYRASGIFTLECAAALANGEFNKGDSDRESLWMKGGSLTPAAVVGDALQERLKKFGMTWEFEVLNQK